jgi:hypothetical protein
MKNQPSAAMEKGLMPQLTRSVTPDADPAPVLANLPKRRKINLQQHRHDHQPDQDCDRQIDLRDFDTADNVKHGRGGMAEENTDEDAEEYPESQIALED